MKHILAAMIILLTLSACSEQELSHGEIAANPKEKSTNIVGGDEVEPSDSRVEKTVLITGKYENGENYTCTGTLIDADIVLTAAHCIGDPDSMKVVFGENPVAAGAIDILKAKAVLPHKEFNKTETIRNDIALIQMESAAPESFSPATLPWAANEHVTSFKKISVFGYGITSGVTHKGRLNKKTIGVLRTTHLDVIEHAKAGDTFSANQRIGKGICAGDSGGPAFIREDLVVGVISRAITDDPMDPKAADDDVCNYESVFTSVAYYKTWILKGIATLHEDL